MVVSMHRKGSEVGNFEALMLVSGESQVPDVCGSRENTSRERNDDDEH